VSEKKWAHIFLQLTALQKLQKIAKNCKKLQKVAKKLR